MTSGGQHMDTHKNRLLVTLRSILIVLAAHSLQVQADGKPPSTVTFINKSGSPALVVLVGPTHMKAAVGDGASATINVPGGDYELFARYGDNEPYRYGKGNS